MATGDRGGRDGGPGKRDPARDLFEEAMRDVQPIEPRPLAPAPRKRVRHPRGAVARPAPERPTRFEVEERGEHVEGRVPGVDRRRLARLRRGEMPPEVRLDLHGLLATEARSAVRDALLAAHRGGSRVLLVIHGRGLHSPAGPVLKSALPGWLAEPPVGSWVLAFVSAPPDLGGPGATLVLLRGRRRGRRPTPSGR